MNINRDYLIINDVKKSNVKLDNGSIFFSITDKNTQNIFVNLVINVSKNDLIQKYANIENAEDYTLTMNIVKPNNTYKIIEGKLHDKENAIFEFDLSEDCCDKIGTYRCELLTKCNIDDHEEITTSNKLTYKVKASVLNDLDDIVEAPEYPLVIQLFDKLSDIEQYEEDRRANELARQLAEEQRQARFDTLDADVTDSIQAMDDKIVEVEDRIAAKEDAVDTLIVNTKADIDDYKVAKDQEIDDYKTAKDTEINEAITNQNTTINAQNDKISAVENNVVAQNDKLDTLETKATTHETRITATEAKNTEQDSRLDVAENRLANIGNDITNTMQPIIDGHTSRLEAIEAIDVAQNSRLDAIEVKNQQQDDRLLDIEKVNNKQDIDIKCLYGASQTIDVTKEGNSIYLQNSNNGFTIVDEIKGNTLVNCNKEPDKELILNGNINTSADNTITLTEGVDGGLVDVSLEGNTLVNVSKTKDSTAITKAYTVENSGNHIALQGDVDGSCRPVITGNTLVNLSDISTVILTPGQRKVTSLDKIKPNTTYTQIVQILENSLREGNNSGMVAVINEAYTGCLFPTIEIMKNFTGIQKQVFTTPSTISSEYTMATQARVYTANTSGNMTVQELLLEGDWTDIEIPYFKGLQSTFEDNLVTQEMVDSREEVADNLGKYRVDYKSTREDGTVGSTKTLYLNSPLLEGDTIEEKDNGIYHVHRSELAAYTEGDETSLITDKVNTLHQLETPTYELIEQSNLAIPSYANGHLDFNSAVPVKKVDFKPFSEELTYLYANTQYTVQFVSDKAITADITLGGTSLLAQSIVAGLNRISITTPATLVNNKLIIDGVGANISEVVVTDTNREFMYFEGMKSVGECEELEVKSCNKNLYNFDWTIINTKNDYGTSNGYMGTIQKLKPNTKYYITVKNDNNIDFDDYHVYISGSIYGTIWVVRPSENIYGNNSGEIITDNNGFVYFRTSYKGLDFLNKLNQLTFQIEEGSTATDYISHQSNSQTLNHEPLRAVGDVKDRYVLIDGKWYIERNVIYCDSTIDNFAISNETQSMWGGTTTTAFKFSNYGFKGGEAEYNSSVAIISDSTPCVCANDGNRFSKTESEYLCLHSNGYVIGAIKNNKITSTLVNYFKNNPLKFVTLRNTPVYEPLDYNPLEVYSDITHITTNSVIPCNITVKNHGFNCLLKPSTTYTISSNLGLNTVTTPSTLTEDCLRFMDTDTSDVTTMKNVLVLEGDWTSKADLIPANFSGIESAFEQEYDTEKGKYKVNVKVTGKNLFSTTWKELGSDRLVTVEALYVEEGKTYWFTMDKLTEIYPSTHWQIWLMNNNTNIPNVANDYNKGVIQCISDWKLSTNNGYSFTSNYTGYVYIQTRGGRKELLTLCNKTQLEQGDIATAYEPYKENNITFYIDEPLRGTDTAKDKVYVKDDKVVVQRNCGIRAYEDGDFGTYLTDKVDTVYQLAEPTYEEVEYNDTKLFIELFKNSTLSYNSNIPVTSKLHYSYSVPIVDTIAQTANVTDQQDSMIIDLATQVAVMEMMLM